MVVAETLPSGLRLVTESMPHVRSVTAGVWVTRGSRHEADAESGVAHFIEHMLFKGTTTRSAHFTSRFRAEEELHGTTLAASGRLDSSAIVSGWGLLGSTFRECTPSKTVCLIMKMSEGLLLHQIAQ